MSQTGQPTPRRADAARNRTRVLDAARAAFAEAGGAEVSMAEVARRAGVGMATLYRNFPGRRDLLEALLADEVDAVCAAGADPEGETPGEALRWWLRRFLAFTARKHPFSMELLAGDDAAARPLLNDSRARVIAAGEPLLTAAQRSGEVRTDLQLAQVVDLVMAVSRIQGEADYVDPILDAALAGLSAGR